MWWAFRAKKNRSTLGADNHRFLSGLPRDDAGLSPIYMDAAIPGLTDAVTYNITV